MTKEIFNKNYNCTNSTLSYIIDNQIKFSYYTNNLPIDFKNYSSASVYFWDMKEFNSPPEFSFYARKNKCTDCFYLNIDELLSMKLEKIFSLIMEGVYISKHFDEINLVDPLTFFKTITEFVEANLYPILIKEYNHSQILIGSNDISLNILRNGSIYDNFFPDIISTTGFDFEHKINFTLYTGKGNTKQRIISKINGYNYLNKNFKNKIVPLYKSFYFTEISDGFQFNPKNYIYYYDKLSSQPIEFKFTDTVNINGINCYYYTLNNFLFNQYNQGEISILYEKFNKPYVITDYAYIKKIGKLTINNIKDTDFKESYICVEKYSHFVVSSNITLLVNLIYIVFDLYPIL